LNKTFNLSLSGILKDYGYLKLPFDTGNFSLKIKSKTFMGA